jgi:serine/threonine-protein kinase
VLHRDLKPSNILLDAEGQPHVVDFGLAKRLGDDQGLTITGAVLGTPGYLAPDQAMGQKGAVTTLTDVYGLGAILYALLAGRPPYEGASLSEVLQRIREQSPEPPGRLRRGVDRDLETICLKCLQRDPDQRYASAEALAADLDRYLRGEPILARPLSLFRRLWLWCRRRERIREAGTFAIGLGVTLFTWCAAGFLMVWAGSIQPKRTDRFLIYLACCMFGVYLPLIGLGWKTLQNRLWAIWGAIGLALFGCGYMIARVSGLIHVDSGGVLDARDATMAVGGDALIIVIALLLLLYQVLALVAHYSNKR